MNTGTNYITFIRYGLKKLFLVLISAILFFSCTWDKDHVIDKSIPAEIRSVNNYFYDNMRLYYLWSDQIPGNLNPDVEPDPKAFFDKMIFKPEDKWSFITDDYEGLINSFQGIDKSFGFQFRLFREASGNNVFGIVEYVLPGSPADDAGIKRGDIFNKINNIGLDVNNYKELLFGVTSYTVGFAEIANGEITSNGLSADLTAVNLQKDPVYLTRIFNINGQKIGYLVYLQFIPEYNDELRKVFSDFKAEGIRDLVLDFRYNPGGAVNTAQILSSMIAPQNDVMQQDIFAKYIWNKDITDYIRNNEGENSDNLVLRFLPGEISGNLNLSRVFILTTDNTASASELIINSLKPYMHVITVGSGSAGKYTASITFHDPKRSYEWAIQPIVVKLANAKDESDYKNGFPPDYDETDDYFSPLGDLNEDMLATAISVITGIPADQLARKKSRTEFPQSKPLISASRYPVRKYQYMSANGLIFSF